MASKILLERPAVRANFNRAAYDAQNQVFTSRLNRHWLSSDRQQKAGPTAFRAGFWKSNRACALRSLLPAHYLTLVGTQPGLSIDVALQALLARAQDVTRKLLIALASYRLISAHLS